MLRVLLFHLLMSLPPSKYTAEDIADREARMHAVANAVVDASEALSTGRRRTWPGSERELALVLTTIAWHESGLDRDVHAGECKPFQCDPVHSRGKVVRFRAASLWQIHSNAFVPQHMWQTLAGTDEESTRRAALVAGRIASVSRNMCTHQHRGGDWLTMTFAAYGTGGSCFKESAKTRAATFRRFDRKLAEIKAELTAEGAA
jgi:hypothetical protein